MLKKFKQLPALIFLILFASSIILYSISVQKHIADSRDQWTHTAESYARAIETSVDRITVRASTLKEMIIDHDGDISFFDRTAPSVFRSIKEDTGVSLKNLALAPDGTVSCVYPLDGNEALIGFSFLDETKQGNAAAIEALSSGIMVVTDPFTLTQGGVGMAARMPVMLRAGDEASLWGLVTVTMDFDELLSAFHLDDLQGGGGCYALKTSAADGTPVMLASSAVLPEDPQVVPIEIGNLRWTLEVSPVHGWYSQSTRVLVYVILLISSLLVALMVHFRQRLDHLNKNLKGIENTDPVALCRSRYFLYSVLLDPRTGRWNDPDTRYSLALVDIDRFREVNDTYGHDTGDRCITAVASVLTDCTRAEYGDCVARIGGDDFIVLWNNITRDRLQHKLEMIQEGIAGIRLSDHEDLKLTVSIGAVSNARSMNLGYHEMLQQADQKLSDAKNSGRAQVIL